MTEPLKRPARKNPLVRTQVPMLPPSFQSRTAQILTAAAAEGRFALQECTECGTIAYPPRDACSECLSDDLPLTDLPAGGKVLSHTLISVPGELYFRERAPWLIGLVKLDCGPILVAHLHADCATGDRVRMSLQMDKAGNAAAFGRPEQDVPNMTDDTQWREMTAAPKFRRVLVTAGRTRVGQTIAGALADAGGTVFVGISEPWIPFEGEEKLKTDDRLQLMDLSVDDERSVRELAALIGGKVDILVNTNDYVRPGNLLDQKNASSVRDQLNQHFIGFVHLAQAFGGAMRARGADGSNSATAWVNVFSAYALANANPFGAFSAVQAGCLSLSHSLRGELRPAGVRVINLFTGPIDDEWYQTLPAPKVAPHTIASALVKALQNGQEDVFVDDIARDIRERIRQNQKGTERALNKDQSA
ncbi:short-chain dehydrogenase [Phyllobacterium phragmitis]|uniref:Short-chain dehydrogenase n=1 Tax=Phyllobacterium phragmitis TaxID=2670329 RepID=A0A2S9ISZ2_9HYPH|nr:SDR family NAD(P)-dependent oxidoreductase [Phyllobacterium phragmitis]PRD43646.1 short-chain dehydrogenase [Phyllobacterium phragmitis]